MLLLFCTLRPTHVSGCQVEMASSVESLHIFPSILISIHIFEAYPIQRCAAQNRELQGYYSSWRCLSNEPPTNNRCPVSIPDIDMTCTIAVKRPKASIILSLGACSSSPLGQALIKNQVVRPSPTSCSF